MIELSEQDLRDLIEGCTVLGTGGGGDPEEGWKRIKEELDRGRKFRLLSLSEVPSDGIVPMPYFVGSLSGKKVKSVYEEGEDVRSFKLLEEYMGEEFAAVISTELGGANTAAALATAARLNRPIVDGDPAGRSVPELQHTTYYIVGIDMAPFSVVTPYGDELVVPRVKDDFQAERIVRSIAAAIETNVGVTSHPVRGEKLRDSVVKDALSHAMKLGRALREAREEQRDPIDALLKAGNGYLLFRGIVTTASWKDKGGFTIGEFVMEGVEEFAGENYRVTYKNENMMSWRNGEVDVTVPDLISVLTPDGFPVTNPHVRKRKEYVVVGFPAPQLWRTPKGLEIFGPKYLGLEIDYIPIEKKHGRRGN